jgi:hypothetical protein
MIDLLYLLIGLATFGALFLLTHAIDDRRETR